MTQCGDLEAPASGEVLTWDPEAAEESPTTGAPLPRVNPEARATGEPETVVGRCSEGPTGMATAPRCLAEHTTSPTTWELTFGVQAKVETGVQLHQVVSEIILFLSKLVS